MQNKSLALAALATFVLLGCGDKTDEKSKTTKYYTAPTLKTGNFIDGGVEGLEYVRYGATYVTERGGTFKYYYGNTIEFKIGLMSLGSSPALSTLTPKDLVVYENLDLNTSIYAPEVNNRVRVLMTLDTDKNPNNGIQISQEIRDKALYWATPDYNLTELAFTSEFVSKTNGDINASDVVSQSAASTHFANSLRCIYSGAYRGSWLLEDGAKTGFVGVLIQSNGHIVALGDGQDVNGDGNYDEYIYSSGTHDMDTGTYSFNTTYHFDEQQGRIVGSNLTDIEGNGTSQGFNKVLGSFTQDGQTGHYTASRVGSTYDAAYRYTGFGYMNSDGGEDNTSSDALLGLFTFDINRDGEVTGMIHDARTNEEPTLIGDVNFTSGDMNVSIDSGDGYYLRGSIDFNTSSVHVNWYDAQGAKLGYINGIGCQLQSHN